VTHGFGVFNAAGEFQFQAQVIPEHTVLAIWTFTKPGTYQVVCYEFCGVNHHNMLGQFEVTQ
jgi:cytochrome c oxidase subunit 2